MRYLIAIDVGIKNLGMCVFDFASAQFIFWENVSLVQGGRYAPCSNVKYVMDLVARYQSLFGQSAVVLVERQMRCNMRIIEAVVQALFYDTCIIINPKAVKAHYGLSTKNYRTNKQKAVEWVDRFVHHNPSAFQPGIASRFHECTKKDDLADSLLLVTYYLDTYSNQLSNDDDELFTVADDV